jgi:hypothetical protein
MEGEEMNKRISKLIIKMQNLYASKYYNPLPSLGLRPDWYEEFLIEVLPSEAASGDHSNNTSFNRTVIKRCPELKVGIVIPDFLRGIEELTCMLESYKDYLKEPPTKKPSFAFDYYTFTHEDDTAIIKVTTSENGLVEFWTEKKNLDIKCDCCGQLLPSTKKQSFMDIEVWRTLVQIIKKQVEAGKL